MMDNKESWCRRRKRGTGDGEEEEEEKERGGEAAETREKKA